MGSSATATRFPDSDKAAGRHTKEKETETEAEAVDADVQTEEREPDVVASHYATHANKASYEEAYFYAPGPYMDQLVTLTRASLQMMARKSSSTKNNMNSTATNHQQQQQQQRKRCILDIGGGTGNFAYALLQNTNNTSNTMDTTAGQTNEGEEFTSTTRIVVIDPFLDPTTILATEKSNHEKAAVSFIKAPAEDFLRTTTTHTSASSSSSSSVSVSSNQEETPPPPPTDWRTTIIDRCYDGYDQVLLKEVVHHFENVQERIGIFRGIRTGLRRNTTNTSTTVTAATAVDTMSDPSNTTYPALVIITRPQLDIDYPLWDAARTVWQRQQPHIETIRAELASVGYTQIAYRVEAYPCAITLARWQHMIKTRCWSTFAQFTDRELHEACQQLDATYKKTSSSTTNKTTNDTKDEEEILLRFEDRLIFLTAS